MSAIFSDNSLYLIVDGPLWTDAEANANKLGGHLVTINDQEENEWVLENLNPDNEDLWIGISDKDVNDDFQWSSGEDVTFTDWAPGEPNGHNEQYGKFWSLYNGKWDDASNNDGLVANPPGALKGIAEIPFVQYDENSAYVLLESSTWEEAQAKAEELGGNLVTINSDDENQFLTQFLADNEKVSAWIGYKFDGIDSWHWQDGSNSSYTNWDSAYNQPDLSNNLTYGLEHYGTLIAGISSHPYYDSFGGNGGTWHDSFDSGTDFGLSVGIVEIPIDTEDYSTYSEADYSNVQWNQLSYTSFSSVKYQSLNWSYADFGGFDSDTWSNLDWGQIEYSEFSITTYTEINWSYAQFNEFNDDTWSNLDWGNIQYNEFSSTSYTGMDWGQAKFNEFDKSDYKDINWGGVQFDEFDNSSYSSMDWGKVQYNELGNDDYSKLNWGKVQYNELGNDDYAKLNWGKVQYNELGNDDYARLDWGKIQYNELGKDDYAKLNWGKVQYNELGNDDYTKLHWGKVEFKQFGNDDYTKTAWNKVQMKEFGNDDYKAINWGKVQYNEVLKSTANLNTVDWGKIQTNEWDENDLKILTKTSTAKKLDKLKKAELNVNVLKKGSSFKGDKDDDVIKASGNLLKKKVTVKGGAGNDTFVLQKGKGSMVIQDFKDKVDEINFAYCGAVSKIKLLQYGKDTLIYSGKDLLATVKKTKAKLLKKSAFGLV